MVIEDQFKCVVLSSCGQDIDADRDHIYRAVIDSLAAHGGIDGVEIKSCTENPDVLHVSLLRSRRQ